MDHLGEQCFDSVLPLDVGSYLSSTLTALIREECEQALWFVCPLRIGEERVKGGRKGPLLPPSRCLPQLRLPGRDGRYALLQLYYSTARATWRKRS